MAVMQPCLGRQYLDQWRGCPWGALAPSQGTRAARAQVGRSSSSKVVLTRSVRQHPGFDARRREDETGRHY
jgi:hypothetical protein